MTDLRTVAQQALESIDWLRHHLIQHHECLHMDPTASGIPAWLNKNEAALRAALAEPENWELRRLSEELERCKQVCAATSEAWREEAALAEPVQELQRKPLTTEEIEIIWFRSNWQGRPNLGFARAIERAHGINEL